MLQAKPGWSRTGVAKLVFSARDSAFMSEGLQPRAMYFDTVNYNGCRAPLASGNFCKGTGNLHARTGNLNQL
jgi:hypothetical protein